MRDVTSHVRTGDTVIVDGSDGIIIVRLIRNVGRYREEQARRAEAEKQLEKLRTCRQTTDGHRITLAANMKPRMM